MATRYTTKVRLVTVVLGARNSLERGVNKRKTFRYSVSG